MPKPEPLDPYLDERRTVLALGAGAAETSFYPALKLALDAAGQGLSPRVAALHHPSGKREAGIPDFGLFLSPADRRPRRPPRPRHD